MKKQPYTHFTGMVNHEAETIIATTHKEGLKLAEELGLHYSKDNRPELKGDSLEIYTSPFTSRYRGMEVYVKQTLQPESAGEEIKIVQAETDREKSELNEKVNDAEAKKHNLEHDLNKKGISTDTLNHLKPKMQINLWIILINITEAILNIGGLQLIGNNWLFSLIISSGITSALFMLAKYLAKFLKENTVASKIKKAILIGASCLALSVFYLLASLRAEHLKEQHFQIHPIFLVMMNVVCFSVIVWHFYNNTKSMAEEKELEYLLKTKEKLENLDKQIAEYKEQIKFLLEETSQKITLLKHKPEYAESLIERIGIWEQEAIEHFKSVNHIHRKDRKTPDCFKDNKSQKGRKGNK